MRKKLLSITVIISMAALITFVSCDDSSSSGTTGVTCGDGAINGTEQCDGGELDGNTCQSLGYYGGTLLCSSECRFDTSQCESYGRCGDSIVQDGFGEECDSGNLGGMTCQSLGYEGGTLSCDSECHFDTTQCEGPQAVCGNGSKEGPEQCDGTDLGSLTCEDLGYYGGQLRCTDSCRLDVSGCRDYGKCGDGIIQDGFGEQCDNGVLGGVTCGDLGYYGGQLRCTDDCRFDVSECTGYGWCGDGYINGDEECDGSRMGTLDCTDFGYYGGNLSCSDDCSYDMSDCESYGWCGDGIIQNDHEECDGWNFGGQTCESLGYYGGTLSCSSNCAFILDSCEFHGRCGDGIVQSDHETCDGQNLSSTTCQDLGYDSGTLACASDCSDYDTSACSCSAGRSYCNGSCVDDGSFLWDPSNCGACGQTCGSDQVCVYGECVPDIMVADYTGSSCSCTGNIEGPYSGDDRGGIAANSSYVLYNGDSYLARFDSSSLSYQTRSDIQDSIMTDIATGDMYVLYSTSAGSVYTGGSSAELDMLMKYDADNMTLGNGTAMSTPISLPSNGNNGIFSGPGYAIIYSYASSTWYLIMYSTGKVYEIKTGVAHPSWTGCENHAVWGVAGYDESNGLYVDYINSSIYRYYIDSDTTVQVRSFGNLSDMCSFVAVPSLGRWYWHSEGSSNLCSSNENVGYCSITLQ